MTPDEQQEARLAMWAARLGFELRRWVTLGDRVRRAVQALGWAKRRSPEDSTHYGLRDRETRQWVNFATGYSQGAWSATPVYASVDLVVAWLVTAQEAAEEAARMSKGDVDDLPF